MKRLLNIITLVFATIAPAACAATGDKPLTAQDLNHITPRGLGWYEYGYY